MALVSVICLYVWPVIINGFGICYMLNVCVLSRYLSTIVEIVVTSWMFAIHVKIYTEKTSMFASL